MNIPEQPTIPKMPETKEVIQHYPLTVLAISRINRVLTELRFGDGNLEACELDDRLIIEHPMAYLGTAIAADTDDHSVKDLIHCLEGYLS